MMLTAPLFGQESAEMPNDTGTIVLSWEAVRAAYQVAIRQDGQVFYETETTENELRVSLSPGIYEYQVAFIDPFGNVMSESGWQKFEIQYIAPPLFRVIEQAVGWSGDAGINLEIDATNLKEGTTLQLVRSDERIPLTGVRQENIMKFMINASNLSPGIWDLLAISPTGKEYRSPAALRLRKKTPPQLDKIDNQELVNAGISTIEISGAGFDEEMRVMCKGLQGEIPVIDIKILGNNKALISLNLEESKPGYYSIFVISPSGEETSQKDVIFVQENEEDSSKKARFGFYAGYGPMLSFLSVDSKTQLVPTPLAIEAAIGFNLGVDLPFLRALGSELHGVFGIIGPSEVFGPFDMMGGVDVAAYWRPIVRGRVAPLLQFGIGSMWFNFVTNSESANFLYLRFGLAMDFLNNRNYFQLGASLMLSFSYTGMMPTVGLILRRGIRL